MKVPTANRNTMSNGTSRPYGAKVLPGLTLLELTMVIVMMLSMISILFIGARAWKRGSDRTMCIIQIQNMQKSLRAYSNLYGYAPGTNTPDLLAQIIGPGRFVETTPICPSEGEYIFGQSHGENTIPPMGSLYMECSLASDQQHMPDVTAEW